MGDTKNVLEGFYEQIQPLLEFTQFKSSHHELREQQQKTKQCLRKGIQELPDPLKKPIIPSETFFGRALDLLRKPPLAKIIKGIFPDTSSIERIENASHFATQLERQLFGPHSPEVAIIKSGIKQAAFVDSENTIFCSSTFFDEQFGIFLFVLGHETAHHRSRDLHQKNYIGKAVEQELPRTTARMRELLDQCGVLLDVEGTKGIDEGLTELYSIYRMNSLFGKIERAADVWSIQQLVKAGMPEENIKDIIQFINNVSHNYQIEGISDHGGKQERIDAIQRAAVTVKEKVLLPQWYKEGKKTFTEFRLP